MGDSDFVEEVKKQYLSDIEKVEDLPELRKLQKEYISGDKILEILKDTPESEKLSIYYLRKYTDNSFREVVKIVNGRKRSISAVSKIVSRIEIRRRKDKDFDRRLKAIERSMSKSRPDNM